MILCELVKSRFIEMFGDPILNEKQWDTIELGELCEIGSSKRIFESEYVSSGIPFYRTKEIVELSKGNSISTELFISNNRYDEIKERLDIPKKNDLLISAVGTIGTIWIVDNDAPFYFKDGNLLWIKASDDFSSIYMRYLLDCLIEHYKKDIAFGTAYSALTITKLKEMIAYKPPINIQNQFAAFVQHIYKLKFEFAMEKSLKELETNFNSLM
jgi:type I restriction enzyme, S subunit